MSGIKSPIGSRTFGATSGVGGPGLRTFEIKDESEYLSQQSAPPQSQHPGYPPGAQPIHPQYGQNGPGFTIHSSPPPQQLTQNPQYGSPQSDYQNISETEAQMRQMRQAKVSGRIPIDPGVRERIEYLSGIGRLTKDITVGDTIFSIRTLKARENRQAIAAAASVPRAETLFEGRIQQLARAIYKMDGQDVDIIFGTKDVQVKVEYLEEMDDNVSNFLYEQYAALNDEAIKKYGLRADEDVNKVVEDVKK